MTQNVAFWQLGQSNAANLALLDPIFGAVDYGQLRLDMAGFGAGLADSAKVIGTEKLLVAIEMSARSPVIAAYLSTLAEGHVVLVGAPGSFSDGNPLISQYAPNLIVTMAGDRCAVTQFNQDPVDLHADLALLLSTSGTTGDPKLVRLSTLNIASNAAAIAGYLHLAAGDRAVVTLPLHYIYGLSVLHAHLQAGAALVLTDLSVIDQGFAHLFEASRGTSISVVPHQVDLLLANGFRADTLPGLKHVAQAGGKLAPTKVREMAALARQGGWSFFVMYGQTEASPRMAFLPPDMTEAHSDSVGRAIEGGRFAIRDASGAPITANGIAGDLIYCGPNVMMGYARCREDLALPNVTKELPTGDVAEFTASGFIKIVGRSARFAKLFGLRISLDQVELLLRDAGFEAFAMAIDDHLAVLLPDPLNANAARSLVANTYGLPMGSIATTHLETVPLLPSGKVDFKGLEALARRGLEKDLALSGKTLPLRQVLALATRRDTVSLDDSYSTLGGDSLGYLQVQIYLNEHLGAAPTGWENMTLRDLEALNPDGARLAAFWSSVDVDVALRVAAITCVILVHLARLPVGGGTWLLLMIMGFSFARFQRPRLINGHYRDVLFRMLHPILLLYAALLLAYHLFEGEVAARYVLLVGNSIVPGRGSFLTVFWFVSLYAQMVVVLVALFQLASVRRAQELRPWHNSALMFALSTGLAIGFLWLSPDPVPSDRYPGILGSPVASRGLIISFPIVVLGMMMFWAKGRLQNMATIAGLVLTCLIFPETSPSQPYILGAGGMLLLSKIPVPLPALVAWLVTVMASCTLFVYLLHNIIVHFVRTATPTMAMIGIPAACVLVVAVSFCVGYLAKLVFDALDRKIARWWRQRRVAGPSTN